MAQAARKSGVSIDERFDQLFTAYHRDVLAYCLRRLSPQDAEDAAAEVFAVAWRRLNDIPDDDRTVAWLYGVAHRIVANQWRSTRRLRQLNRKIRGIRSDQPEVPDTYVIRHDEEQALVDALRRLGRRDQEVLMLATWEKLSHRDIAQLLGVSPAAVGQRVARAKKRLGNQLRQTPSNSEVPPAGKNGGSE